MKLAFLSLTCEADESFLDLHQASVREAYQEDNDIDLFVSGDTMSPPKRKTDFTHVWKNAANQQKALTILNNLIAIARKGKYDYVVRTDSDCWHNYDAWISRNQSFKPEILGFQTAEEPACFYGGTYAMTPYALSRLSDNLPEKLYTRRSMIGEDEITSLTMHRLFPNEVFMYPSGRVFCGWKDFGTDKYLEYAVVHCGQRHMNRVDGIMKSMYYLNDLKHA